MKYVSYYVLTSLLFVSAQASGLYYRYTDNNGVRVISSKIPAQYVPNGYEIITKEGKLVERILPEPSEEEKERIIKEKREQARLEAWDKELLRRYSHPDDIEDAKERKLAQNRNDLGIIIRSIEKINDEIQRYQSLAAADERVGRDVNVDTLAKIESLKIERDKELYKRREKELERQSIMEKYDQDIERFKIIRPDKG